MLRLLGQANPTLSILIWSASLIVLTAILALAVTWARKRTIANKSGPVGFTLSDLREMRKSGKITEAEFEVAKNQIVKGMKKGKGVGGRRLWVGKSELTDHQPPTTHLRLAITYPDPSNPFLGFHFHGYRG
jgi:hypothetical protein